MMDSEDVTIPGFEEEDSVMEPRGPCDQHGNIMEDLGFIKAQVASIHESSLRVEATQVAFTAQQLDQNEEMRKEISKLFSDVRRHSTLWGIVGAAIALIVAKIAGAFGFTFGS